LPRGFGIRARAGQPGRRGVPAHIPTKVPDARSRGFYDAATNPAEKQREFRKQQAAIAPVDFTHETPQAGTPNPEHDGLVGRLPAKRYTGSVNWADL
jgi:hypothetical protein